MKVLYQKKNKCWSFTRVCNNYFFQKRNYFGKWTTNATGEIKQRN